VEVVATLKDSASILAASPSDRNALVTVRRAFHTLKGSGRMVGLTDFGEAAWQIEKVLNGILEADRAPLPHEVALMNAAATLFARWVGELEDSQRPDVDLAAITRLVAACERRELTFEGNVAPVEAQATAASSPDIGPVPVALPPLTFTPVANPRSPTEPSAATLTPLPELDFASPAISVPTSPPPVAPDLASALPFDARSSAPAATATEKAEAQTPLPEVIELPASAWTVEDENVVVEGVTVPRTLFSILVDESRAHLQTLEQELALLQFDPAGTPSESMVRAAHTLCGIHRTAGFTDVGELAAETENALVALSGAARDGEAYTAIASAIA
ncbi:MAG: Hpt domain-containing protein, partial [Casimicrobiaceae bacterium]